MSGTERASQAPGSTEEQIRKRGHEAPAGGEMVPPGGLGLVLGLQQSVGNRAVSNLISSPGSHPISRLVNPGAVRREPAMPPVQRKPADTYTKVTKAGLSKELKEGVERAKGNQAPGAIAVPPWNRPTDGKPYNSKEKKAFASKWAWDYKNVAGTLPGVAGAGGYNEYYAEPTAGATTVWGDNRVLKQTNDPEGTYWWVCADHYTTFKYVTDA